MREWLSVLNVRGKAMTEDKHNKHVCLCNECIALRMAKALEKIQAKARKEGKLLIKDAFPAKGVIGS